MATSEEKIHREEQEWVKEKAVIEREIALDNEKHIMKQKRRKKVSTSKWLIFFLFFNCTVIELFVGWCTVQSLEISRFNGSYADFTPLVTVIGAVVSEVIGYAVYAIKSAKENCAGGIQYDMAMRDTEYVTPPSDVPISG